MMGFLTLKKGIYQDVDSTLWKRDDEPPTRAEEVALLNAVNLYLDKIKTGRKIVPFQYLYEFIQKDYQKGAGRKVRTYGKKILCA